MKLLLVGVHAALIGLWVAMSDAEGRNGKYIRFK